MTNKEMQEALSKAPDDFKVLAQERYSEQLNEVIDIFVDFDSKRVIIEVD